ncbi:unnamed protein product [Kuraishia capsulata CBS 1993]|uniref:Small-subunit processome Utp12 domain-containing protein n=1 Tax=Kuraishia capsulata CBS 1993 TaxID=1382522 RepID=W6MHK2_9ASCO|nr:uncharacterized protein KUCA_T00001724001 [Kuraishia capsulata CBS 1993]CDK25754.1 unnamed protein product [Kuraishia capsulata CBS 1993]
MSESKVRSGIHPAGYFGCVSKSRGGRNEVIISPLVPFFQDLKHTIELEEEEIISELFWIVNSNAQAQNSGKRNKRKHATDAGSTDQGLHTETAGHLAIILENGEVLFYDPVQKRVTSRTITSASRLLGSDSPNGSLFAFDSTSSHVLKISPNDTKVLKEYKIHKQQHVTSIHSLPNEIIIGTTSAVFVLTSEDDAATKLFQNKKSHPIAAAAASSKEAGLVALAREGELEIEIVSLIKKGIVGTLKTTRSTHKLKAFTSGQEEFLIAVTDDGISIFSDPFKSFGNTPTTTFKSSSEEVSFFDAVFRDSSMTGFWIDNDHFHAEPLQWSRSGAGEVEVSINFSNGNGHNGQKEIIDDDESSDEDEEDEEDHEYASEESSEVVTMIKDNIHDHDRIAAICSQNFGHARQVVQRLDQDTCLKIFPILSLRIADQPQSSMLLNTWLQTIIILHGNSISKDADLVGLLKLLKSSLSESVKLLPNMLALQGRLILLESQLALRSELSNGEALDGEPVQPAQNGTVVYDGENDEYVEDGEAEDADDDEEDDED